MPVGVSMSRHADRRYPALSIALKPIHISAVIALIFSCQLANAQFAGEVPEVAREFIERVRRIDGENLRLCVYDDGLSAQLDRRVAEAIGDVLLVNVSIVSIPAAIRVPGIEFVPISEDELYIYLNNDCEGFMGITLASDVYPDWLTFTRPYVSTTFSVLTLDEHLRRLGDLPPREIIGTTMLSEADLRLIAYNNALSEERRWRRFPYNFASLLYERLVDGTVDAAIMWTPSWAWIQAQGEFSIDGVRLVEAAPLSLPTREIGIILRSNETFIRNALDQAIEALDRFGMLAELYETAGFPGAVPAR